MKECLNNEKRGRVRECCLFIPSLVKRLKPDSVNCPFYEEDIHKELEKVKKMGGMCNVIRKHLNKITEEDIREKKKQRKPKSQ